MVEDSRRRRRRRREKIGVGFIKKLEEVLSRCSSGLTLKGQK